jgi:pyruvate dehydrogenase E1 component beta subunit
MAVLAQRAADKLAQEGISCEIVDIRSLRPLDTGAAVESVKKTNHAVVVEEDWRTLGMGSELAAQIYEKAFDYLDAPIARVAAIEVPLPYSKPLEAMALPDEQKIIRAIKETLA